MKKKKICLIVGISPFFLGGVSLYQKHLLDYIESKKLEMDISVLYSGNENLSLSWPLNVRSGKIPDPR